ncbi:putative methyltransferase DDB_G0268948 [Salvelinus fontinalis]|uniref:putative methyltransferase DDB_G0268948 n=1 Tax=Salvelinus fontinalis TaxID=8038 RepID=UPI0024857D26|nr:putative methyltransferase DDB_G0268948 [Salvelinus fontinalis]
MTHRLFEEKHHASIYQRYRFVPPEEIRDIILHYLERKKVQPHALAVDLGCGTGQNSRLLAPHFQEVVGIDISECQLEEARAVAGFNNITYRKGTAEELPFPDGSVDLLTAASAAHWFDQKRLLLEAGRVLKPCGCMALLGFTDNFRLHYGSCEDRLTDIFDEFKKVLLPYTSTQVAVSNTKLRELYVAIPFPDKERIECIPLKQQISVRNIVGFMESFSMYQAFQRAELDAATALLQRTLDRFLKEMGVTSPDTLMEVTLEYFCVLASKPE